MGEKRWSKVTHIQLPGSPLPVEESAAACLVEQTGARVSRGDAPGAGFRICLEDGRWPVQRPADSDPAGAWLWIQVKADGGGAISSNQGSFL